MRTKLARITEIARERPKEQFTSLVHLLNQEMLTECHRELGRNKASGVDQVTKDQYQENLEENIKTLVTRLKSNSYRPQPVKRVYIPKPGSSEKRPLGIPAYEDKIVQLALSKILTAIYEVDFLDCSFGFRPGKSGHEALKLLDNIIMGNKTNWIVDADIKGFFNHVSHEWMINFLGVRIKDPSFLRLIGKILKAGYLEAGVKFATEEGTPQGGVISPILANIYLHYALDLWFEKVVRRNCKGSAQMVRYADDCAPRRRRAA